MVIAKTTGALANPLFLLQLRQPVEDHVDGHLRRLPTHQGGEYEALAVGGNVPAVGRREEQPLRNGGLEGGAIRFHIQGHLAPGHALDEFHDEAVRPHVMQRADMRLIQLRNGAGFAGETLGELGFRDFESNDAVEPEVTRL